MLGFLSLPYLWYGLLQLTLTDEQFMVVDKAQVTPCSELCGEAKSSAQRLLNHYVRVQGLTISQV